jgi:tRNA A37 threonylcarbamoyladenosine dehydratase
MMDLRFQRTALLVGEEGLRRLAGAHVAIAGLGGVGSYAAEAIGRAGVGRITLADFDVVEATNLNRQLVALESTIGRPKANVAAERLREINPEAEVRVMRAFVGPDNLDAFLGDAGYVIDAIDSVEAKVQLLAAAHARGLHVVSCMGAANKLSPVGVCVDDIGATRYCPLARVVRQGLRRMGIDSGIRCVYTRENRGVNVESGTTDEQRKKRVQGSISYVPGLVGLTAAGVVVNDILGLTWDQAR